ncbi:energy coupling factor transporter S component ThiW [Pelagirhabdus alkalitolerans]|uniref:Energy coupling factor transporter S component ThiW n=1 Tax=Pelagirhabdus alkalitolerans TaxID=1612202 RepID=A0A1G6GKD6_9BACI|nr:energy coupling factor transporter S component ThiW [Pelagirhabdus alkalitolerans]SDB82205.1 energy coupling factor transporter S component ThiW [Pelagirhabdus alkalitolerans]
MRNTRKLTLMAALIALGVLGATFIWFPTGVARAYPVQHALNVITAVILGPGPAVIVAFGVGLLRNLLGLGTLLAFPGGIMGALLAGLFYKYSKKHRTAVIGEVIGTSIFGSLLSIPIARLFMGDTAGVFAFVPGFFISSLTGALLAWLLLARLKHIDFTRYLND